MITKITLGDLFTQLTQIHADRRPEMTAAFSSNVALAIVATILRLISRRIIHAPLQADDYTIIAALLITMIEYAISMYGLTIGAGRHSILVEDPIVYAKVVLSLQCLYIAGTWLVKTSILLLYRRLFGCNKRLNRWIWGILIFVFAHQLTMILLSIFSCRPVEAVWDPHVKGWCINVTVAAIIFGSINVCIDIVLLVLPIPLVWRLKIQRKWRIQLIGVFLLGGFVCLGSIYRTTTLRRFATHDPTWNDVDPAIWAIVENSMGIVSACLPTLRPLFSLLIKGHRCSIASGHCATCEARASTPFEKGSGGAVGKGWVGNAVVKGWSGPAEPAAGRVQEKKTAGMLGGGKGTKIGFRGPEWSQRRHTRRMESEAIAPTAKPPPRYSQAYRQPSAGRHNRSMTHQPSHQPRYHDPSISRPSHHHITDRDRASTSRAPWWVPYNSFAAHPSPLRPSSSLNQSSLSRRHQHHDYPQECDHHPHRTHTSPPDSSKHSTPKRPTLSWGRSKKSRPCSNCLSHSHHCAHKREEYTTDTSHDTDRTLVSETGPPTPPKDSPFDSMTSEGAGVGKVRGMGWDDDSEEEQDWESDLKRGWRKRKEGGSEGDLEAGRRERNRERKREKEMEERYKGVPFIEIF